MAERKQLTRNTLNKPVKTKQQAEAEFDALLAKGGDSILDTFNCTCYKLDGKCTVHNKPLGLNPAKQRVVQVTHKATTGEQKRVAAKSVAVESKSSGVYVTAGSSRRAQKRVEAVDRAKQLATETAGGLKTNQKNSNGRGGARAGAGRPAGSLSSKTQQLVAQLTADGLSPLEFMLTHMRDVKNPESFRADMAKAAAPYIHPRLSSTEVSGAGGKSLIPAVIGTVPVDAAAAVEFYKSLLGG